MLRDTMYHSHPNQLFYCQQKLFSAQFLQPPTNIRSVFIQIGPLYFGNIIAKFEPSCSTSVPARDWKRLPSLIVKYYPERTNETNR